MHFVRTFLSVIALSSALCAAEPPVSPWGMASSASGMSGVSSWMPRMREIGVGSARMFPEWPSVEPKKGEWKWERMDEILNVAKQNQIQLTAVLMGKVPWSADKGHTFPMSDLEGWAGFVGESARRYKDSIRYWEVWNEGNGGFNDGKHTAVDYAKLASAAYGAVKNADSTAQVGLTTASFDPAYLQQTILAQKAAGGAAQFDYLCVHPYELADGIDQPDGEIPFLWMSRMLRDVLKKEAPEKADAGLWITEIGRNIAKRKDKPVAEKEAAVALVKIYTMSLAQGFCCVQWFEAQDPAHEEPGFGLIEREGRPRAGYEAMRRLVGALGMEPKSIGWMVPAGGERAYGFVFEGVTNEGGKKKEPVLIAWNGAGQGVTKVPFTNEVQVRPLIGDGSVSKTKIVNLGPEPVAITGLPAALLADIAANAKAPYPWGGDFSKARTVGTNLGGVSDGVYQTASNKTPQVTFPDGTTGVLLSANQGVSFHVHPSFASLFQREYHVRITVRRVTPGNVGMNLFYEIADTQGRTPYKNAGTWFGLTDSTDWQTFTWHVKDACFAKMWGNDISFRPEQSQPFVIGKVEVSVDPFK